VRDVHQLVCNIVGEFVNVTDLAIDLRGQTGDSKLWRGVSEVLGHVKVKRFKRITIVAGKARGEHGRRLTMTWRKKVKLGRWIRQYGSAVDDIRASRASELEADQGK
jgi:hypothetical protein